MSQSYVVYADESNTHDDNLAHRRFYGGCLVSAKQRESVVAGLEQQVAQLGIQGEIKWKKVRPFNADRIIKIIDLFFDLIDAKTIKFRVLWLPKTGISITESEHFAKFGYYISYYFFLLTGFALAKHDSTETVLIEFYPDKLPDEADHKKSFVDFLLDAHNSKRYRDQSPFRIIRVADVNSKKHVLLQCSDVVIGALAFLMNERQLAVNKEGIVEDGTRERERVARHIVSRISSVHNTQCNSNYTLIGSTWVGKDDDGVTLTVNNWRFKYRQWAFSVAEKPPRTATMPTFVRVSRTTQLPSLEAGQ